MNRIAFGVACAGILATAGLGLAGTASAAPVSHNSATEAIGQLRDLGCTVQVNVVNCPNDVS